MLKYFEKGGGGGQTGVSLKKKIEQDLFYVLKKLFFYLKNS